MSALSDNLESDLVESSWDLWSEAEPLALSEAKE